MTGTHLAHYRIDSELGRGGMGIVYRAHDTKLDRTVALKVLPPHALSSEDDRARFQREARAAAKLQHAHIASIFEIGEAVPENAPHGTEPRPFIAMEFVDGESLADRIARGPLKIAEATRIGSEIAEALEVAHDAGIVHRDVKSGNVMLTSKGQVKVLDFGLAKTAASTQLTRQGSTVGTVAYMSPEQARGEDVDARTDLWALGVVLYEMVAGRLPFPAEYEQAALYGILNEEPDPLTAVRTGVPMPLEWILGKLLAKNADARYQSAREVVVDLRNVDAASRKLSSASVALVEGLASPVGESGAAPPGHDVVVTRGWPMLLLVAIAALTAGYFIFSDSEEPEPIPLIRVEVPLPALQAFGFPALSPTREWLGVFAYDTTGQNGIYLHELATGRGRMIPESVPAAEREFYFSPDGTRLAFTANTNGGAFVVTVPTGRPLKLNDRGRVTGWLSDEELLIVDDQADGSIYRYDLRTNTEHVLLEPSSDLAEGQVDIPKTVIPGTDQAVGHRLIRRTGGGLGGRSDLVWFDFGAGTVRILETGAINPEYVNGGYLMYQQGDDDGPLVVRPIDERTGEFLGPPRDVFPDGRMVSWGGYHVTSSGDLLFDPTADNAFTVDNRLYRVNLGVGSVEIVPLQVPGASELAMPSYSPDGREALLEVGPRGARAIWLANLETGSLRQMSFGSNDLGGRWSPDGDGIWYETDEGYIVRRGMEEGAPIDTVVAGFAPDVSISGRYLAYASPADHIYVRDLQTGEDLPVDTSVTTMVLPAIDPSERYVAYNSDVQTGSISVRPIFAPGRYDLPGRGNWIARWSPDGRYLYFSTAVGIRRIRVSTARGFSFEGQPEPVVEGPFSLFDISPDGTELLVSARSVEWSLGRDFDAERHVYSLVWLQNWSDYLRESSAR